MRTIPFNQELITKEKSITFNLRNAHVGNLQSNNERSYHY